MEEEIFKISKNKTRAKVLKEMAVERLMDVKKEEKVYKIIEQYYEVVKELITSLMYIDGFKTLSHKALINYLEKNYTVFKRDEFILMDELRRLRNDILYYGQKVDNIFLKNNEAKLRIIINKLIDIVNKNL